MTIEQVKRSAFAHAIARLDNISESVDYNKLKNEQTNKWIEETMKHYDVNNISLDEEYDLMKLLKINKKICSTPTGELKSEDISNRFESAYSEINDTTQPHDHIINERQERELCESINTQDLIHDSELEDTSNHSTDNSDTTLKPETTKAFLKCSFVSQPSKDWLMNLLLNHANNHSIEKKVSEKNDCIIVKIKSKSSLIDTKISENFNIQSFLHRKGYGKSKLKSKKK